MNLCLICLRTDRILKVVSGALEEFYNDICEIPLIRMSLSRYSCSECEYQLTEFYKFKERCMKAHKIHQKWLSAKASELKKDTNAEDEQTCDQNYSNIDIKFVDVPENLNSENIIKTEHNEIKNRSEKCQFVETHDHRESLEVTKKYTSSKSRRCKKTTRNVDKFKEKEKGLKDNSESKDFSKKTSSLSICKKTVKKSFYDKFKENDNQFSSIANDNESKEVIDKKASSKGSQKSIHKSSYYDKIKKNDKQYESVYDDNQYSTIDNDNESKEVIDKKTSLKDSQKSIHKSSYYDKFKENDNQFSSIDNDNESKEVIDKKTSSKGSQKSIHKSSYYDKFKENDKQYESVFDIEYLMTEEEKMAEFERRKSYKSYVNAEHRCEICYQGFKSDKFLEYHTKKNHTERSDRTCCPICKIWYSKTKKSNHKFTHTMVFKCKLCPLITYYRNSMHVHYELHKGQWYKCEQCNITCKSKAAHLAHLGRSHRLGRHVCGGCGRGFRSHLGLNIHRTSSTRCTVALEHNEGSLTENVGAVRCDECDVTFASQLIYDRHIFDVHSTALCSSDNAKLSEHNMLTGDVTLKSSSYKRRKPKITCRVCNKEGLSFYWLQLHFKREHPAEDLDVLYADKKPHLCEICGTGFCNIYALRDHKNSHTGVRPHACDLCSKNFHSGGKLREHRLRHFPPTVPCEHCGKRFKTKANLYTHMLTHSGEKNNKCDICGKTFVQRSSLNEHVRGVHFNIRRVRGPGKEGQKTKRIVLPVEIRTDFSAAS